MLARVSLRMVLVAIDEQGRWLYACRGKVPTEQECREAGCVCADCNRRGFCSHQCAASGCEQGRPVATTTHFVCEDRSKPVELPVGTTCIAVCYPSPPPIPPWTVEVAPHGEIARCEAVLKAVLEGKRA